MAEIVSVPWHRYDPMFAHSSCLVLLDTLRNLKYLDPVVLLAWKAAGLPTET